MSANLNVLLVKGKTWTVAGLLARMEWEPLDVGGAERALHLEHMTLLWVRMVRMGGRSPRTVWAMLTR